MKSKNDWFDWSIVVVAVLLHSLPYLVCIFAVWFTVLVVLPDQAELLQERQRLLMERQQLLTQMGISK